jgi:predicted Zn-dependent protease with MMP-like domain
VAAATEHHQMNRPVFKRLVQQSLADLPEQFRAHLDNLEIVVEDWPDPETLRLASTGNPASLLGFYHGVPLTARSTNYGQVMPDRISIYRRPVLLVCANRAEVRETVDRVLKHEIGHHFGISDQRLREIGAY